MKELYILKFDEKAGGYIINTTRRPIMLLTMILECQSHIKELTSLILKYNGTTISDSLDLNNEPTSSNLANFIIFKNKEEGELFIEEITTPRMVAKMLTKK